MGMGRTRNKSRAGWPANLYPNRDGFKYRHPVSRKETWMGTDRAKAFAAAKHLNALLMPSGDLLARVVGSTETVKDAVKLFRDEEVPKREWEASTAATYRSVLNRIESGTLGDKPCESVTVKDCATFIRNVTASDRARQQFRLVLGWVLAGAVAEGWMETNPALATKRHQHKRKRDRLTEDTYQKIHAQAPAWLQNAMELSLLTLLRREDIVSLRREDVHDGALWVIPGKTEGSTGAKLQIGLSEELEALLARCKDDGLASPYLIHRLPERARPREKRAKARDHHMQVLPEQLSRAFAEAREAAEIASDNPPTFHEIRSFGGARLRKQGWTEEQVQALMAHTDISMTRHYLDGHEQPWTQVSLKR